MIPVLFDKVSKTYGKKPQALTELSFELKPGCITGFIGRNGAGKSTTINLLANLLKKNQGEIKIFDTPVKPGDWQYKSRAGFVLEKHNMVEYLTASEYLNYAGTMHKISKGELKVRVKDLLNFFDLENETKKLIKEYSKGMKKKLALATALIHKPELLVLDEPLEGTDPVSANLIKKFLRSQAEKGCTIFISSHELATVQDLCDELIIIHKGKSIFQGTLDTLRKKTSSQTEEISLEEIFVHLIGEEKKEILSW